jgi:hypothetical protein
MISAAIDPNHPIGSQPSSHHLGSGLIAHHLRIIANGMGHLAMLAPSRQRIGSHEHNNCGQDRQHERCRNQTNHHAPPYPVMPLAPLVGASTGPAHTMPRSSVSRNHCIAYRDTILSEDVTCAAFKLPKPLRTA